VIYVLLSVGTIAVVAGGVTGYFLGRYQANLLEQIRTLQARPVVEAPPEPEKPTVAGGAYSPPREISNVPNKKQAAGIVESKTPQQMDWEAQEELRKLEHST
jgi:hypothetical protein